MADEAEELEQELKKAEAKARKELDARLAKEQQEREKKIQEELDKAAAEAKEREDTARGMLARGLFEAATEDEEKKDDKPLL